MKSLGDHGNDTREDDDHEDHQAHADDDHFLHTHAHKDTNKKKIIGGSMILAVHAHTHTTK